MKRIKSVLANDIYEQYSIFLYVIFNYFVCLQLEMHSEALVQAYKIVSINSIMMKPQTFYFSV